MVWYCLVVFVAAWFSVTIWQGYELWMIKQQLERDAAKGLRVMGPIHRGVLWLVLLLPSIPALILLLWLNPKRAREVDKQHNIH
jgi:hypothetical protein